MSSSDVQKLFGIRPYSTANHKFITQFIAVLREKPYMTPEEINAVIAGHVEFLYAQYGVQPLEHSDWVHTGCTCTNPERNGYILTKNYPRPLNSWALKNPVVIIPSNSDLEKIAEWRRVFLFKKTGKNSLTPKPFQVRNLYIVSAVQQLEVLRELLVLWRKAHNPTDQSECQSLRKSNVYTSILDQNKNILLAKDAYKMVVDSHGPEFLRDAVQGVIAQEEGIRAQLYVAIKYSN